MRNKYKCLHRLYVLPISHFKYAPTFNTNILSALALVELVVDSWHSKLYTKSPFSISFLGSFLRHSKIAVENFVINSVGDGSRNDLKITYISVTIIARTEVQLMFVAYYNI